MRHPLAVSREDSPSAAELRDLFRGPLAGFVAARNHLATSLRAQGRAGAAAEVRQFSRPSIALWAVNRVADAEPAQLQRLFELGDRLAEAQSRLIGGDRQAAAAWRSLGADQTVVLRRLLDRAAEILLESGHAAGEPVRRRLETTLRAAAAAAPEIRSALAQARLATELEPGGFGSPAASVPARAGPAPRRRDQEAEARRADAERERREAAREHGERSAAARRLRREAERTALRVDRARADLAIAEEASRGAAAAAGQAALAAEAARQRLEAAQAKTGERP